MNLTAFLFVILLLGMLGVILLKILNSRAARMLLLSYRFEKEERALEQEAQKTRMRFLEEIKNPDRVMETILKMQRGEEVKIPLAAFDYIYRNLNKFTLVDKEVGLQLLASRTILNSKKRHLN